MTKPLLLVAAAAMIDADGRVLVTQRPAGKAHAGKWEFPGGKVEPGETPEQAVNRELREELGLEPCERCLQPFSFTSHAYEDFHLFMPLYLCRQWDGFAIPNEGQGIKWLFPNQIVELDLVEADVELARELKDRLPSGKRFAS
jgi:8-oxo-dGTP diphosphatase